VDYFYLLFVFFCSLKPHDDPSPSCHGKEWCQHSATVNVSFAISSKSYLEQHEGEVNENRNYSYKLPISLQSKKRMGMKN